MPSLQAAKERLRMTSVVTVVPLPILVGVMAPIIAFLAGRWRLREFRHSVLVINLRLALGQACAVAASHAG